MRRLLAIAAATLAAGAPGTAANQGAAASVRALAPFEIVDRVVYVRGSIDGSRPLWILISSGSTGSAIDTAVAKDLGIAGGATVTIGGAPIPVAKFSLLDLSAAEDQTGHEIDAVLGYELFSRYAVEFDYYGQLLRLHDPAMFRPDPRAVSLPLRIADKRAFVMADVELAGRERFSREYRLDTGIGGALIDEEIKNASSRKLEIAGDGFAITLTRTRAVGLGPFRFAGANGISGEPSVGGELLRRFTTVIDYNAGRLSLLPNRHFDDRFCFEMLGVELSIARAEAGMRIDAVYKGSTAEKAGFRIGDILTAIDGAPTSSLALGQVRMMFGQQNSYRLTVRRGAQSRIVPVTLSAAL